MSTYRLPEFLSPNDEPKHRVRCPVYGFIHFSPNERTIIDHPLFRRLRYIRQLALTEFVYPGATHSRFEHSLGVMDVATRSFDSLAARHGSLLEHCFKEVIGFEEKPLALARQALRIAALLHDIGHASFSHAAEKVVHKLGHEKLSISVAKESGYLGGEIDRLFGPGVGLRVGQIISGDADLPPQLQVLHEIISGEMDADRTDYLLRDAHHCGVEYGRFDHNRLIECLAITESEGDALEIALGHDGIHAFEALIIARYQMNNQVYYHRLRRIYDYYLIEYFKEVGREMPWDTEKVLANNDITMMAKIMIDAKSNIDRQGELARRIYNRDHHRVVFETGANANALDLKNAIIVHKRLVAEFEDVEFVYDVAEGGIHKLLVPEDQNGGGLVDLRLIGRNGTQVLVGEKTQVLRHIPRRFQCARIFAAPKKTDSTTLSLVQEHASAWWAQVGGR